MKFDTKIAIVIRDDLAQWQKLNVAAFLSSGVVAATPDVLGQDYVDARSNVYTPLIGQPMIILSADADGMSKIFGRARSRGIRLSLYVEEMFSTGSDEENRAAVRRIDPADMRVAGLALREDRRVVDRVVKGAKMHA